MFVSKRNLFFKSKENGYLLFCGNSNSFFQVDEENVPHVQKMFDTGDDSELPEDIKKEFIKTGVLLPESDKERFKRLKFISYQTRFNPYILNLTIAPTMACNFKCTYCYEGDRVQNIIMNDDVIDGLINFIKKRDCKTLNVTWYGGEPLCAWNKVVEITKRIEKLNILNVNYSIVTNGSLINDEIIQFFIKKKFKRVQITLDGDENIHNQRRPMKNGKNSFQTVLNSLDKINSYLLKEKSSLKVSIRVNLDKTNLSTYKTVYDLITSRYNHNFYIYPTFLFRSSENDSHSSNCMSSIEYADFILRLANTGGILTSELFPLRNKLCHCDIQIVNSFIINPIGEIYKCWDDISLIDKRIGNVITGLKDDCNIMQFGVMQSSGFEDEECKDCIFLYSCMGGCPKHRFENRRLSKELNQVCSSIRKAPKEFLEAYYCYKTKLNKDNIN